MNHAIKLLKSLDRLLTSLEDAKRHVGETDPKRLERLIVSLDRRKFTDAISLARFHDALLFLCTYPPNRAVLRKAKKMLLSFAKRVEQLQKSEDDLSSIDNEEYAGIAGTILTALLSYDEVRWLIKRFPESVSIDWKGYEQNERLAAALPRFIPLLEEDSFVEPDVPYQRWLREASNGKDLIWLIRQLERLPLDGEEKAEIFGESEFRIRWELGNSCATRTHGRLSVRRIYYHTKPMIRRKEVSLVRELSRPPLQIKKLSRREGIKIIDLCREATTVRYRELYGTTRGDPEQVVHADVGRGVEFFLWGLPPERRLPLRAYQAGITLKNGIPVNYIEAISLFEWMEIGFNMFYTYRDGETAWIYAQGLRLLHQLMGVSCISVYPYQIGKGNEEAIESGAFWFYRKLGFRPMRPDLAKLVASEEKKIAQDPAYRTPHTTLRRLAQGHLVFELPGSPQGEWDHFRMRTIGLAVQRRMAEHFDGNAGKIRQVAKNRLSKNLEIGIDRLSRIEKRAFENFALALLLVPDLPRWTRSEKDLLLRIIRAKAHSSDARYARLLQDHPRLRAVFLTIGSSPQSPK